MAEKEINEAEEISAEQIDEAPVEELDEAPAGVQDLGGDNPDTGKANKPEPGTSQASSRKADKRNPEKSAHSQGNSVKPAVSEDKVSNSKNGMVAQVYEMLKNMSKEELGEKFGLIQDIVELDVEKMEEDSDPAIAEAQEKILYSRKDLTSDEIELDTEADIQAIAGEDLSEEFKEKAKEIFESAVKSKVVEEVNKRVSQIEEEYLQEIEESTKTSKIHPKTTIFGRFFKVCSILAEKQRPKPKNLSFLKISTSFDTLLDPRGAKVKQISEFLHFVLKFDNSGALYNFFFFSSK